MFSNFGTVVTYWF